MPDITTTVDSSEATVKAVRSEAPVGVGGEAIARIPYAPSMQKLLDVGTTVMALKGTHRCIRVVNVAVQGGGTQAFHCSRPCVGVHGQQLCPEHDRESFMPSQSAIGPKPKVTNSSQIKLTKAELEEMGIKEPAQAIVDSSADSSANGSAIAKPKAKPKPKGKPRSEAESIEVAFSLDELATDALPALVMARIAARLDELPAGTISRMKKIVALQDHILKWGK